MKIFESHAWYHPLFTNFIGGVEVNITFKDDGSLEAIQLNDSQVLFSVKQTDIKQIYDRDMYSLGVVLHNDEKYMFSFSKRLDAGKAVAFAPFYYNWIAPLMNNPLLKERKKLLSLLNEQGVTIYKDKKSRSVAIGIIIGLLLVVGFWGFIIFG